MILKRTLPLFAIIFFLTGCFRQAEDTFDTVGSQNTGDINITQPTDVIVPTETSEITIIDPNATTVDAQSAAEETATPRTIAPTEEDAETEAPAPTNTSLAIPTATGVVASATPIIVPTATEITFVTPEVNVQVEQATATPRQQSITSTLEPTPTGIAGTSIELGDCDYEVQDGDNLFRIALNNDISLASLLSSNGLTEASIIQPGQVLTIPGCDDSDSEEVTEVETEAAPTALIKDDCDVEIATGDTLFGIAVENGVTLAELLAENGLTENSVIQPGQIVTIPNCDDGDEETASDNESSTTDDQSIAPEATEEATVTDQTIHTVSGADTLLSIARQYNVTVNDILQANTIPNPNNLTDGQQLVIPDGE